MQFNKDYDRCLRFGSPDRPDVALVLEHADSPGGAEGCMKIIGNHWLPDAGRSADRRVER